MKLSGCVIEDQVNYVGHVIGGETAQPTIQENSQACAEHCAAREDEGGRYWTYNKEKGECWIKTSIGDRRLLAHVISGSLACGL